MLCLGAWVGAGTKERLLPRLVSTLRAASAVSESMSHAVQARLLSPLLPVARSASLKSAALDLVCPGGGSLHMASQSSLLTSSCAAIAAAACHRNFGSSSAEAKS